MKTETASYLYIQIRSQRWRSKFVNLEVFMHVPWLELVMTFIEERGRVSVQVPHFLLKEDTLLHYQLIYYIFIYLFSILPRSQSIFNTCSFSSYPMDDENETYHVDHCLFLAF